METTVLKKKLPRVLLIVAMLLMVPFLIGCVSNIDEPKGATVLRIFYHGSVAKAVENLETKYEETHKTVDVQGERSPSSEAVRKVTDLNRSGDIVMVGDYNLIQTMMMPEDASWWIRYSTNQISIAYTSNSKYASSITPENWYSILAKDDVKVGIADPNMGPDGYRALITLQLAEREYGDSEIFEKVISNNSAITSTDIGSGKFRIECPEDLAPDTTKLSVRSTPVALLPLLETGEIDYAFQYYSDAKTYSDKNPSIKVLQLGGAVNLGDSSNLSSYKKISIVQYSDIPDKANEVSGDLIANGFTIPKNAENTEDAVEFIKLLLGPEGKTELNKIYIIPMEKAEASNKSALPAELQALVA